MQEASDYCQTNDMPLRDTARILEEFWPKLKWNNQSQRILDIGSGSGNVTYDVLWRSLAQPIKDKTLLLGVDVTEEMVDFSNVNFATLNAMKERQTPGFDALFPLIKDKQGVAFAQLDFNKRLPSGLYEGQFSKIFSFYCLHWLPDQTAVHSNIFRLLQPKGEALLLFLAQHPLYKAIRALYQEGEWLDIMKDAENFLPPFDLYEHNQAKKMEDLLQNIGFNVKSCEIKADEFTFDSMEKWRTLHRSVTPFWDRLESVELQEAFLEQSFEKLREINSITVNDIESLTVAYELFVIHVEKP